METTPDRDLDRFTDDVRAAPRDAGPVVMIVRRPTVDVREVVDAADLDPDAGLVGDDWSRRRGWSTPDGSADREVQLTIMGTRVLSAIEPDQDRWPLAGDQLYVDLDLSVENLPPGARLAIGDAIVRVSEKPHTGCAKFSARFGSDALRWINGPVGRELRMRGVNARIEQAGTVRVGDTIRRI
jgi:hypothetical protein